MSWEKAPLDPLVAGGRGGGGFHRDGDGDGDGNDDDDGNGDGSSGSRDGGSGGGSNSDVEKAPPNPLVSENVHDKRADDDSGPASEVEQRNDSTSFPTPFPTH